MRSPLGELAAAAGRSLARIRNDTPVPYVGRGGYAGGGAAPIGATGEQAAALEAPGNNGTLFSIINRLSTSVAALDWHMHQLAGPNSQVGADDTCDMCGAEDDAPRGVRLVTSHPALSVWSRPNDFFTSTLFVETFQQHVDLVGEGYWIVAYVMKRPIELWPVRPDRMAPVRDRGKFIDGWVYRSPDGQLVPLRLDEVVPLRQPAPWDPYRGAGAAQAIIEQLYGARYAAQWNRRFFENSAIPAGVIEMPAHLPDPQWNEFQERWAESHKGVSNAHRVAVLEHGARWVDTNYSMRDMQFSELRRASREETREAFGIHGHVLGLTEDVNRANAEAGAATYAQWLVVPRAERIKDALNGPYLKLFGDFGKGYAFAYVSPVPADREAANAERTSKTAAWKTLVDGGADPDDAADYCGLPRMRQVPKPAPVAPAGPGFGQEGGAGDGAAA